jgi:hypothetical protein
MNKLDVKALGLALGIVWGVCVLLIGITSMLFNYGTGLVNALSSLYIGYKATLLGSLIGGIWGFFDAGIGGVIIAWLYNKLVK